MLKNIPSILLQELLKVLMEIGHGGETAIYANILLKKGVVQA